MTDEKYVSPEGFSIDVAEAFSFRRTGIACLVIQSNEDRDIHFSEIRLCEDFSAGGPKPVFEFKGWIYSMYQESDAAIYMAHTGKMIRYGPHSSPEIVLEINADVTKLCASSDGVWIVGLRGYVAHFDGTTLTERPVPDAGTIFMVSEAPDGTVFACGAAGGLYRLDEGVWTRIPLPVGADIFRLLVTHKDRVLIAGAKGLCGIWEGDELRLLTPPDERHYRAIAEYKGRIFVGAGFLGLDLVEDGEVVPYKENVYSYHLNAAGEFLIAGGLNQVARYDGESWLAAKFT